MFKILYVCGEVSGDGAGAYIHKTLKWKILNDKTIGEANKKRLSFVAIGGSCLREEGVLVVDNLISKSAVGVVEGIVAAFTLYKNIKFIRRYIKEAGINLIILIDNQGLNISLARYAKKLNIPVIYYFPPSVSLWGRWNIRKINKLSNIILCPFYNDYKLYHKQSPQKSYYIGHYLTKQVFIKEIKQDAIKGKKQVIGIYAGSRYQEVRRLMPIILYIIKELEKEYKTNELLYIITSATKGLAKLTKELVKKDIVQLDIKFRDRSCKEKSYLNCDIALAASGTVTIELGLACIPMVIIYKVNWLTYIIAKLLLKGKYIGLPNILLNKRVVPEILLQSKKNTQKLLMELKTIIENKDLQSIQKKELNKLHKKLYVKDSEEIVYKSISKYL